MDRWPLHKAYFWEYAPFFRVLVPFVLGIVAYEMGWVHGWQLWVQLAIIVTAFLLLCAINLFKTRWQNSVPGFVLLQVVLFFTGNTLSLNNDVSNKSYWLGNHLDAKNTYLVRLKEAPREKEKTWKLQVDVVQTIQEGKIIPTVGKAIVYLRKDRLPMLFQKGDSILVPGKWQPVTTSGNPFEFNYAAYARRNNIHYQQFCTAQEVRLFATNDPEKASFTTKIHDWCHLQLNNNITDGRTLGLIQAMLLGDEANLDEDLRNLYADTGIVHVIAISGGNVMIFFTFVGCLLFWLRYKKYRWVKFLIALPLVWVYVIMAGASPSAIRAAFMFTLLAVGNTFQKNNNGLNQLFAASFLLLVAEPMWLFSVGFQLSFIAVLSLIIFYRPICKLWRVENKYLKEFRNVIAASLAAEILVAPVVIYYFHNFPVLFLVANVLAWALMTVVLYVGILIIALGPLGIVAQWLGSLLMLLVAFFERVLHSFQAVNPTSFKYLKLTTPELIVVYLIIIAFSLFVLRRKRQALFAGLGLVCCLLVLLIADKAVSLKQNRLVVYNVGSNVCIEQIFADRYSVVLKDTLSDKKRQYATNAAHIMWQAWQQTDIKAPEVLSINGKRILLLGNEPITTGDFPVDYVVANINSGYAPEVLARIFHPEKFIFYGNAMEKDMQTLINKCKKARILVHLTSRDGAFIYEGL